MNLNFKRNRNAEDVAADWMDAKNAEIKANKDRVAAEEELIALLVVKQEGATSHQVGPYKITLTGRLNRKVDLDVLDTLQIPAELIPIKMKRELDVTGVKYLDRKSVV